MNNLEKRISQLEERLGIKPGPRFMIITNVDFLDGDETPNEMEFLPGLYVLVMASRSRAKRFKSLEKSIRRQAMSSFEQRLTRMSNGRE